MSNGLSLTGFQVKSSEEILLDIQTDMKSRFGETYALDENTEDGAFLKDLADLYSEIWVTCGDVYNSLSPATARDVALSKTVQFNGITRKARKPTNTLITVIGVPGSDYEKGILITNSSGGDPYVTVEAFSIDVTGSVRVEAEATEFDTEVVLNNTLTMFDTGAFPDIYSVNNNDDTTLGNDSETDGELRVRRDKIIKQGAAGTNGAVKAALEGVFNMESVKVIDNPTNSTDANGLSPHGVAFFLVRKPNMQAGETTIWEDDVVEAIVNNKSMNSAMNQQLSNFVTKTHFNNQGDQREIEYHFADLQIVYIIVNINTFGRVASFPPDGVDQIKQAILDYASGRLIRERSFDIGEDISQSEFFIPCYSIPGHFVEDIFIGLSPNPTQTTDLVIGDFERSQFNLSEITVNLS